MIFQSLMGPRKSRCDVHSGTTQGKSYPFDYWKDNYLQKFVLRRKVCDRRQKCIELLWRVYINRLLKVIKIKIKLA
jgi:hypothetical protein